MSNVIDKMFNSTFTGLERTLDLTWQRNQAIASNISNAETPQYRAVDLTFANELQKAFGEPTDGLYTTNKKHLDIGEQSNAHLVPDYSGATKSDGNNVDIDLEMGRLASNSGEFTNAARLWKRQLSYIRNAIRLNER